MTIEVIKDIKGGSKMNNDLRLIVIFIVGMLFGFFIKYIFEKFK